MSEQSLEVADQPGRTIRDIILDMENDVRTTRELALAVFMLLERGVKSATGYGQDELRSLVRVSTILLDHAERAETAWEQVTEMAV